VAAPGRGLTDTFCRYTFYGYDRLGRLLSLVHTTDGPPLSPGRRLGDGRLASYRCAYDAAGRLVEKIDRMGCRTRYQYNVLDQVLAEKWYASGWVAGWLGPRRPRRAPAGWPRLPWQTGWLPCAVAPAAFPATGGHRPEADPLWGSVDAWASRRALRRPCASVHIRFVSPEVFLDMTGSFRRLSKQDSRFQARPVVK
jgi:YD repeat-containing protein